MGIESMRVAAVDREGRDIEAGRCSPSDGWIVAACWNAAWAVTIILSGGTTIMMAGGEESKAA